MTFMDWVGLSTFLDIFCVVVCIFCVIKIRSLENKIKIINNEKVQELKTQVSENSRCVYEIQSSCSDIRKDLNDTMRNPQLARKILTKRELKVKQ